MTARRSRGRDPLERVRRAARPLRRRWAEVRTSSATVAATRRARRMLDRAELLLRARRDRSGRAHDWELLGAALSALPAPPEGHDSVSVVMIAADAAPVPVSLSLPHGVEIVHARGDGGERPAAAAARAARRTTGDRICFVLASSSALEAGWLARLAAAVDGAKVTAAAPQVLHPVRDGLRATPHDGRVRSRGVICAVERDAPVLSAVAAGSPVVLDSDPTPVAGATAACLLVARGAYDAAGGLPDLDDIDLAAFELCRRLRALGGEVVVVPEAIVVDHRDVASVGALRAPIATDTPAWRSYVEDHGPQLARAAEPLPAGALRFAITVAAPSEKVAPRWGDWHLAEALARALRRRGHHVRVQTLDHADDLAGRACDVHCVVRGLGRVRRTAGQAHVLWVISHPEQVGTDECDAADLVLVASTRFADELRTRTRTPVEVMLQATDVDRFRPVPPQPRHAHDVAVVAKSRDVFRTSVADAIAGGLRPAIYGSGWEPFLDPALVVSDYVANEELPVVYSSVGVLLNDHWQTMHEWGFVSNRIFDALACETPIISDDLPEIEDLFDGTVLTYRDAAQMRSLVTAALADRAAARARAARGRELIVARHTFDHRAGQLLEALQRHGLTP